MLLCIMPQSSESISDPTDWLSVPCISSIAPLEAGLRCEICKDFYTAPVITQCSHTFCSGCIRRTSSSVNASRKCPLCWQNFDEGQLRKNKVVEDLVKSFLVARGEILALGRWMEDSQCATEENVMDRLERGKKRKRSNVTERHDAEFAEPSPRKTRSQRQQQTKTAKDVGETDMEPEYEEEQQQEQQHQPNDGKVSCPICQQRMPEAQVFTHLDAHSDDKPAVMKPVIKLPNRSQPMAPAMTSLPTLSYTLLNETQLRKKLRELGIPPDGNKTSMSRRHTEWRNLVNANCDSSHPKSKAELLRELNQWERTLRSSENSSAHQVPRSNVMDKDFERGVWSMNHNSDFQNLIAAAKAGPKPRPGLGKTQLDENESMEDDVPPSLQAQLVPLNPEQLQRVDGFDVP